MNRKLILSVASSIISLFSLAQEKNPLINSGEALDAGVKLYDEGKYKDALKEYQKVKVGDTNYVRALYEMALTCTADSQYSQGIRYCEQALAFPTDKERTPELLVQYASLLDYDGQQERSLKLFDSALAIYPAEVLLYINKGTTLMRLKKYKEAEKVFQQALFVNPYSPSAHIKLGICALNQGKVIPAYLALLGSLVMQPEGNFAGSSISLLDNISKSKDDIVELVNTRTEEPSDSYRLVEQIVLSKIALEKGYKTLVNLDDPISRQMQVILEKLHYDAGDTDFYMQFYVHWYRKLFEEKKFEPLVYHAFSGVNLPAIKEYNRKKKKELESFTTAATEYFQLFRSTRQLQATKRNADSLLYHYSDGRLFAKGLTRNNGELLVGAWEYYFRSGNIKAAGAFNDKGEKEGPWTYYYFNGQVKGKELYRAGKQEGAETYYHDHGVVSSRATYKNGEADGEHTTYYRNGRLHMTDYYKNGKLQGVKTTLFENGLVQSTATYENDLLAGPFKTYYVTGQPESEGSYANDKMTGTYKEWYKHGTLSMEGQYLDGERHGIVKRYHENGKPSSVEGYNKGVLEGEYATYYSNGQLKAKYINKKGKVSGDVQYFNKDGKVYSILTFDDDRIKVARYFDTAGKEISVSKASGGKIDLLTYYPDGVKKVLTPYNSRGLVEGKQIYYHGSGKEREVNSYQQGVLNGDAISYFSNGQQKARSSYVDGDKNGYYTSKYIHGTMEEEGWYQDDKLQGEWLQYDEHGAMLFRANYLNDELNGIKTTYWPTGKKESERLFNMGNLEEMTEYDTTGKVLNHIKLTSGNGKYISLSLNGKPHSQGNYVHGNLEGELKIFHFDGSVQAVQYYKSSLLDSVYRAWHYGGKLSTEGMYKMNEKTGTWKYYRTDGSLWYTETYSGGLVHGKQQFYYRNGKPDTEIEFEYGDRTGVYKKFRDDGNLVVQMRYEDGMPLGYTYLGKNGELVPEIPMVQGNAKLNAFFQNGQPSLSVEYIDGGQHGPYKAYHANGKLAMENTEFYGNSEGQLLEYYPDGVKRSIYNYRYGNMHGAYKEFNAKGIVVEEGNFYNGSNHGEKRFYDDNGKLKKVETYYYGQLLGVQ